MKKLLNLVLIFLLILLFAAAQGQTTSIMTFNIKYDNPADGEDSWDQRKDALVDLIARYHPDILGIQEGLLHQVEFIQQRIPNYTYIGVGREDGISKGEYSAIYYDSTKFELLTHETFWLSDSPDRVSVGWDAAMERICTYGRFRFKLSNETLHVFNTHFDHMGSEARKQSTVLILNKISAYGIQDERLVVMGDFNAVPESEPIAVLKKELDYGLDISESEFQGPDGTFNAFDSIRPLGDAIDYIFTNQLDVISYRHIDDRKGNGFFISDHFPVFIEVKL